MQTTFALREARPQYVIRRLFVLRKGRLVKSADAMCEHVVCDGCSDWIRLNEPQNGLIGWAQISDTPSFPKLGVTGVAPSLKHDANTLCAVRSRFSKPR